MHASGYGPGSSASIEFPNFGFTGTVCLTYYYHMWGTDVGDLGVYTRATQTPWRTVVGDQGDRWILDRITINLQGSSDMIRFVARVGNGPRGDIAIDTVMVETGQCASTTPPPTGNLPDYCDFDRPSLCNLQQISGDSLDWQLHSGSTPTSGTGPSGAQSDGYYIYLPASGYPAGATATLEFPPYNYNGQVCLSYYYHMYGPEIGDLRIYSSSGGNTWRSIVGSQDNRWINDRVTITIQGPNDRIRVDGRVGNGPRGDIALDSVILDQGSCPSTTPPPPTSGLPYYCDFDQVNTCTMQQNSDDYLDWLLFAGATPEDFTGPTGAQSDGYYIYMPASGYAEGSFASIEFPPFNYVGDVCLTFYYHKWGQHQGNLIVYTQNGGQTWENVDGDRGNQWIRDMVTVTLSAAGDRIGIQGRVGRGPKGDIGVDTISVVPGPCTVTPTPPPTSNIPFSCDFGFNDICGMQQPSHDNADWVVYSGSTPTAGTGPNSAQSGNYYIYSEADGKTTGSFTILQTQPLNYVGQVCLQYYYHMWGAEQGTLYIYTTSSSLAYALRTWSGDMGSGWNYDRVTATLQSHGDQIAFYAQRGFGSRSDIAVDNIRIDAGPCAATPPPPTPPPPTGNLFTCEIGFNDLCGAQQRADDRFDWTIASGGTSTSGTGPSGPYSGSYYVYLEADGRSQGDNAVLDLPPLGYSGQACLRFYYHMWGSQQGVIYIYTESGTISNSVEILFGDKGNQWNYQQVPVTLASSSDRISFYGQIGGGSLSDIALDSITVDQGSCTGTPQTTPSPTGLPYFCDFNVNDYCGIGQSNLDRFDWQINRYNTPTSDTGPSTAQSGEYYLYAEAENRYQGDNALVELPPFNYIGTVCLTYYYHMYGSQQGELNVVTRDRGVNNPWWTQLYDSGNRWNQNAVTIDLRSAGDRIGFDAYIGSGPRSDIAIDNIRVQVGSCSTTNVPFVCDFENNQQCGMAQWTNDQFDWRLNRFSTDTFDTGPDRAQVGDWYLYTEANGRGLYDRAFIETPSLDYTGRVCLRFWYMLNGVGVGQLIVYQNSRGENVPLLHESGHKGRQWVQFQRDIDINYGEKIIFLGEMGNNPSTLEYGDIAIDYVEVLPGICTSTEPPTPGPPTPTPPPTPEYRESYSCSAEFDGNTNSPCRMNNTLAGDSPNLNWLRASGRTPSSYTQNRRIDGVQYPVTGPSAAYEGTYYLYVEATETRPGDIARMRFEGSDFQRGGSNCLKFAYTMNGYNMGTLRVYVSTQYGPRTYLWSMAGDQKNEWKKAAVEVSGNGLTEIGIEAEMTGHYNSDFAVDGIRYDTGKCQNIPSPYVWVCDFELNDGSSTLCDMDQSVTDEYDWTLWSGATPSEVTGPDRAFNGQYYVYAEGSQPRLQGHKAVIQSPPLQQTGDMCLEFNYNMHGFHMGTLEIFLTNGVDSRSSTTETGDKGQAWHQKRVTLYNVQYNDMIAFVATRGTGYSGDVAIDRIRVQPQRCF